MAHALWDLPEVRTHLGEFLDQQDIFSCMLTCKDWLESFEPFLVTNLTLPDHAVSSIHRLRRNAHFIQKLTYTAPVSKEFYDLGMGCTNVSALALKSEQGMTLKPNENNSNSACSDNDNDQADDKDEIEYLLGELVRQNSHLQNLTINQGLSQLGKHFWTNLAESCPNLNLIQLSNGTIPDFESADALFRACQSVTMLYLNEVVFSPTFAKEITPTYLLTVVNCFHSMKNLVMLDVHGPGEDPAIIQLILATKAHHVENLFWYLPSPTVFPAERMGHLMSGDAGSFPHLQALKVQGEGISDKDLAKILGGWRQGNLRNLWVPGSGFGPVSFQVLKDRHFGTVTELTMGAVPGMTSMMAQEILAGCPNLEIFEGWELNAVDVANDGREWVCSGLKEMKIFINMDHGDAQDVEDHHALIFDRLGSLTALETLSMVDQYPKKRENPYWASRGRLPIQFRIENGLEKLAGLQALRKLVFMGPQEMDAADVRWIKENWSLWQLAGLLHRDLDVNYTLSRLL